MVLDTPHRAIDADLQRLVIEALGGRLSDDMMQLGQWLSRDLPRDLNHKATHIFAENWNCERMNGEKLQEIMEPAEVFIAKDEGEAGKFDAFRFPLKLRLKVCFTALRILYFIVCNFN